MTITVHLPPATLEKLQAQANATGKDIGTLVAEAVAKDLALASVSVKDVLRPIQDAIAASGTTPEEAEAFFNQEVSARCAC
jgi:predicted transcriptional regulator